MLPSAMPRFDPFSLQTGFPSGAEGKESALKAEDRDFPSQGWEDLWRAEWGPTPVFSPRKSHGQGILVSCIPWGHKSWR